MRGDTQGTGIYIRNNNPLLYFRIGERFSAFWNGTLSSSFLFPVLREAHSGASILYFFGISIRNQMENRYWQKKYFLLFAKCLKIYSFFAFAFKV
jgi:hypothetical protein